MLCPLIPHTWFSSYNNKRTQQYTFTSIQRVATTTRKSERIYFFLSCTSYFLFYQPSLPIDYQPFSYYIMWMSLYFNATTPKWSFQFTMKKMYYYSHTTNGPNYTIDNTFFNIYLILTCTIVLDLSPNDFFHHKM